MSIYNENVVEELKGLCNLNVYGPGAILYNPNTLGMEEQISFISNVIINNNVKCVLETGTESGLFCYLIKCLIPDVKVFTFGLNGSTDFGENDERGRKCTDFLNSKFGNYITFIEGDSKKTLTSFTCHDKIDLAWIDGGHDIETLTSDLNNCARLNIPNICVDDYYMIADIIQPCVKDFINLNRMYEISSTSLEGVDDRGICQLQSK
jgi:hypothetical protein